MKGWRKYETNQKKEKKAEAKTKMRCGALLDDNTKRKTCAGCARESAALIT